MINNLLLAGMSQGLIIAIVAYAIMIPFRILHSPDLTPEGAYPFGGAVCAGLLLYNFGPISSIIIAMIASGFMGVLVAVVHRRLQVNALLAGIILSTMVYSVNLRIMGKPNISLFNLLSIFGENTIINIMILIYILTMCILPLFLFLKTDFGLRLRAVGLNQNFAKRQTINVDKYYILGLSLAGALSGLAGALAVQLQSYMDVSMGVGIVIHGLASLMLGESVIGNSSLKQQLIAPLVGALLYQQIQGFALSFGLAPSDLKFFTGGFILLIIALKTVFKEQTIGKY